jgi:hypothetical protein
VSQKNGDEPKRVEETMRFLHRSAAHGYTANPALAMHGEPEAVSAEYQKQIAREARLRHALDRQLVFRAEKKKILESLATVRDLAHGNHVTNRRVRNLERELEALQKSFAVEAQAGP